MSCGERSGEREKSEKRKRKRTFSSSNLFSRVSGDASAASSELAVEIVEETIGGVVAAVEEASGIFLLGVVDVAAAAVEAGRSGRGEGE